MEFGWETAAMCGLIILARIADVSLGTLRTVCIVQGRKTLSWFLGFFEILIWIFAVSKVIGNLNQPVLAVSYAFGFATGNYIGLVLEDWLSFGRRAVKVFTRRGLELADTFWAEGVPVTVFEGEGRDNAVYELYIQVARRRVRQVIQRARDLDPVCFYVIEDIRAANTAPQMMPAEPSGWRALLKRK